ncbi:MAG: PD40 domain-containing protein [Ardenticatenaceae bacterium]|nr:PD40 domain-containing protein [Ardenticatenaceae bacterium]
MKRYFVFLLVILATILFISMASAAGSRDDRSVTPGSNANPETPEVDMAEGNLPVVVRALSDGTTTRVSVASDGTEANAFSWWSSISADGRYVAFQSHASNLVSGDTNGTGDIFVYDRQTGQTTRVSVSSDGTEGNANSDYPSNSADGRYVAFQSDASNLVSDDTNLATDVFVHDQQTGQTTRVSVASDGTEGNADTSSFTIISRRRPLCGFSI